ncbi:MAG: hypothetical protein JWL79_2926 [Frankiales bacterium]|nr:hypothetical protein [Frankiales bacterium]
MHTPCPHCGGDLRVVEAGIAVAELDEPVGWAPVRRYCPAGCRIVAGEVPEDAA